MEKPSSAALWICSPDKFHSFTHTVCGLENFRADSIEILLGYLRTYNITAIIAFWDDAEWLSEIHVKNIRGSFGDIPWIAILNEDSLAKAYLCGKNSIEQVISKKSLPELQLLLAELIDNCRIKVTLEQIHVIKDTLSFSPLLKKALCFIEEFYVELKSVKFLCDCLQTSESTLVREFQASKVPSPKKILMKLKMTHAIRLMSNMGFNLNEIARISGFSNSRIMTEYFKKIYRVTPVEYRNLHCLQ